MPLENCASNPYTVGNINADPGSSAPPYYGSSGSFILIPERANLTLSSVAPTIAIQQSGISPDAGNLVLSTTAPTVERTNHISISPAAANLILSTEAPLEQPWRLAGTPSTGSGGDGIWDHSGDVANVDFTGLGAFSEVMVVVDDVTLSVSGGRHLRVGHGAGPTYLTSAGDYVDVAGTGVETGIASFGTHSTSATAARTGVAIFSAFNLTDRKIVDLLVRVDVDTYIVPTTNALTAVRILGSSGGNLTGGSIRVYGKY